MKYIITILLVIKFSCLYAQNSLIIKALSSQKFQCHEVRSFSELKDKVNKKNTSDCEVFYISRGSQLLGFLFFYAEEPQFFIANKNKFALFFAYGIDGSISIYDSILSNPHSAYVVDKKKKMIYDVALLWRYPNFSITSSSIYKFEKDVVEEYNAYPTKKIKPLNLSDTLLYNQKVDILKGIQFEKMKFVGVRNNDSDLRPKILVFLNNLTKRP